jgi:iron complex outermembrane receptor protein
VWDIGMAAQVKITAFAQAYDDLILWLPSAGGVWRPTNIQRVVLRGGEASLGGECALGASFAFAYQAEYSLQISENTRTGRLIPRIPQEKGSVSLSLRKDAVAALHLRGSSTGFRYLNTANTKYLDSFFLLDTALGIHPAAWMEIKFVVQNIFDTAYVHLREYPVPGREGRITLEVKI